MPFTGSSYVLKADIELRRPPGALPLLGLFDKCVGCGDCVAVCPDYALLLDGAGLPYLVDKAACTDCGLCADVCVHGGIVSADGVGRRSSKRRAVLN